MLFSLQFFSDEIVTSILIWAYLPSIEVTCAIIKTRTRILQ